MINLLKNIFGLNDKKVSYLEEYPVVLKNDSDIISFTKYVVNNLVTKQKKIKIKHNISDKEINIEISCDKSDMGKIIGRKGQTIKSIRCLLHGAGARFNKKINLNVID